MAKTHDPKTLISVTGPYLKELRIAAGQNQREFADSYGFEPSMLSKLENGNGLGPKYLPRIVEAYADAANISAPDAWAEIGKRLAAERDRQTSQRAQGRAGDAKRSEKEKERRRGRDQ